MYMVHRVFSPGFDSRGWEKEEDTMFTLKACPRCGGDLYREVDFDGTVAVHCLQCGYHRFLPALALEEGGKTESAPSRKVKAA